MDDMEHPPDLERTQQEVNAFAAAGQYAAYFLLVKIDSDSSDAVARSIADLIGTRLDLGIRWSAGIQGSTDSVIAAAVNPQVSSASISVHRQALETAVQALPGVRSLILLQVIGSGYYGHDYQHTTPFGRHVVNGWP